MSGTDVRKVTAGAAAVVAGLGGVVAGRLRSGGDGTDDGDGRWRSVTVFLPDQEVLPAGAPPAPLAELGDRVEVRVRPAPGGRGTELSARLREPVPSGAKGAAARLAGDDPRQAVRSALRRSKQLLEVGEVLRLDPQPAGHRRQTPAGKALELVTKRADREGVL